MKKKKKSNLSSIIFFYIKLIKHLIPADRIHQSSGVGHFSSKRESSGLWEAFSSLATLMVFLWPSFVQYRLFHPVHSNALHIIQICKNKNKKEQILYYVYYLCST